MEPEDWSKAAHSNDIRESTKESNPPARKDQEDDETDDELVIEESEAPVGKVEKVPVPGGGLAPPELSGELE